MAAMLAASFLVAPCVVSAQQVPTTAPPAAPPVEEVVVDDVADAPAAEPPAPDASAVVAAPTPGAMDPAPADASLLPVYKVFGEEAGLVALMDDFMVRLVADPRTHRFFAEADQVAIKKHLVEQFCVILGGPCSYTGRDMQAAHKGFDIDRAAFNALVEDLQLAMDARKIPFRAQNRLLAKLAPMHRDIEHR
jgi:hemoglobin